jgi:hypothetical protein
MLRTPMIVLETPYYIIEMELGSAIVRTRRTAEPYLALADMERDYELISAALDQTGRERKALLIDLRDGPRRNDPEFEDTMRRIRPKMLRGFRHVAAVVRTAVGALQVKRHMREDGVGAEVFYEEEEALDYLRSVSVRGEAPPSTVRTSRPPQPMHEVTRPSWAPSPAQETNRASWAPSHAGEAGRASTPPSEPGRRSFFSGDPGDDPPSRA